MLTSNFINRVQSGAAPSSPTNQNLSDDNAYQQWKQSLIQAPTPQPKTSFVGSAIKGFRAANPGLSTAYDAVTSKPVQDTVGAIGSELKQNYQDQADPNASFGDKLGKNLATGASIAGKVSGLPFDAAGSLLPQGAKDAIGGGMNATGEAVNNIPGATEALNALNDLMAKHPVLTKFIGGVGQTALNESGMIGGGEAAPALAGAVDKGITATTDTVTGALDTVKGGVKAVTPTVGKGTSDLEKIADTIKPKPTAKEAKLALSQGRLHAGSEPGMFTDGTEAKIATSPQQANSARTISRLIPDAANMDETTLHGALGDKVTEIATNLKPEMEKTPISPNILEKINSDIKDLKAQHMEDAPATEEPNVAKRQAQFEKLLKKSGSETMNDLWETAKKYDSDIKENVKTANELSSESLQLQKQEWLDRRAILRDAINNGAEGMGETSKQAFSDMRDMYEAQNAIATKASDILKEVKPSKAGQYFKDHPTQKAILKVGAGVTVGGVGAKAIGL